MKYLLFLSFIFFLKLPIFGQQFDQVEQRLSAIYEDNTLSKTDKGTDILNAIGLTNLPSTRISEADKALIPSYIHAMSFLGKKLDVVIATRYLDENNLWPADSVKTGRLLKIAAINAGNLWMFVDALRFYDKLEQYLPSLSRNTQLRIRLDRAWFAFRMLDYSNGISYANFVEAQTRNTEDELIHAHAMAVMAYAEAMFINDVETVDSLAFAALTIFEKHDDLCGQKYAYLALAAYHSYKTPDEGVTYATKLIEIAQQLNDSEREQVGLAYRGRAYAFTDEFDRSIQDFVASDQAWNEDIARNSAESLQAVSLSPRMYLANVKTVINGIERMQSTYWMIWLVGIIALVGMFIMGYLIRRWQDGRRENDLGINRSNIDRLRNLRKTTVVDFADDEEQLV